MIIVDTYNFPSDFNMTPYFNKVLYYNLSMSDYLGNEQTFPFEIIIVQPDS